MNEKPTACLPIYLEALEQYTGGDLEKIRLFAAGFVHGQAEKVYLGACYAAMFRPGPEHWELVFDLAATAAGRYGLAVVDFAELGEIWITTEEERHQVEHLLDLEVNSTIWHCHRAWLCGIPPHRWDRRFHEREGAARHGE